MQLENGTVAEVTDLRLDGDTIAVTLTVCWPKGPKAQAQVTLTPSMAVQALTLVPPGLAEGRSGLPAPSVIGKA